MAELAPIGVNLDSGNSLGLPPLADILPAPTPKAATLEAEWIEDGPDQAAGELQPIRRPGR